MKKNSVIKILGILCALVMLAVVVLQFLPAWEMDEQSMSVAEYVWFPYDHSDFTKYFRTELDDSLISAGDVAGGHAILLVLGVVGAAFCVTKSNKLSFVPGAVMGLYGLYEYFMQPLYVLTPLGMPLLILCGVITAVSAAGLVLTILNKKN